MGRGSELQEGRGPLQLLWAGRKLLRVLSHRVHPASGARILSVTQGAAEPQASAMQLRGRGPIYKARALGRGPSLELREPSRVCWGRLWASRRGRAPRAGVWARHSVLVFLPAPEDSVCSLRSVRLVEGCNEWTGNVPPLGLALRNIFQGPPARVLFTAASEATCRGLSLRPAARKGSPLTSQTVV